jgi:carbonic anhydrase
MMQLLMKVGLVFALACVLLVGGATGQCAMWSYDEGTENGPEVWGELCAEYAKCSSGYAPPPTTFRFLLVFGSPPVI